MVRGRRPKLRYAHQGGSNPPRIIVHGTLVESLNEDYKRYLVNTFRRVLDIKGTPVRFEFKQGDNPYSDNTKSFGTVTEKVTPKITPVSSAYRINLGCRRVTYFMGGRTLIP